MEAKAKTINVRIKSSLKAGYWYSQFKGAVFAVRLVSARVSGHVHNLNVYEVLDGHYAGDYVLVGDCEVVK